MKIVFCDIDGVLNISVRCIRFHSIPVSKLNRITDETGASIVISSSWRLGMTLNELTYDWFIPSGVTGKIIGMTPIVTDSDGLYQGTAVRGLEISKWLIDHSHDDNYVVLDDMTIKGHNNNFVPTEFNMGIQDNNADKAISILNDPLLKWGSTEPCREKARIQATLDEYANRQ